MLSKRSSRRSFVTYPQWLALAIGGLSVVQDGLFLLTGWYGLSLHRRKKRYGGFSRAAIAPHRRLAWISLVAMIITVGVIDRISHQLHLPHPWFFWWIHLPVIVIFCIFLTLTFIFDGDRHPKLHDVFAPWTICLYNVALVTGNILAIQLILKRLPVPH